MYSGTGGQIAFGMDHAGPITVEPLHVVHPVPFEHGYPTVDNEYNTAVDFTVRGPDWDTLVASLLKLKADLEQSGLVTDLVTDYQIGEPAAGAGGAAAPRPAPP